MKFHNKNKKNKYGYETKDFINFKWHFISIIL